MSRYIRYLTWLVLLAGCSSQPFCDFRDTAPIVAIEAPPSYKSGGAFGSIMVPMQLQNEGESVAGDYIAVTAGNSSQVEVFRLVQGGESEINIQRSPRLNNICDSEDQDDENSTCYQRVPGAGLAYRGWWGNSPTDERRGTDCVAVGMAGREQGPGVGFWCSGGTRHQREAFFLSTQYKVQTLEHLLLPEERMFIGTERALYLLNGDSTTLNRVVWESENELPNQGASVVTMSTVATDTVEEGYLLAVGFPETRQVLIGSVEAVVDNMATFVLYDCITSSMEGFGSVIELAPPFTPTGNPVLITGLAWSLRNEVQAPTVKIFDLELADVPSQVTCRDVDPRIELRCDNSVAQAEGLDVDCGVQPSGWGSAIGWGNIDDTPAYEVIVGAPGAFSDGYDEAGAAYVFRPATNGVNVQAVLIDSIEDRDNHHLGEGIAMAQAGDRVEPIIASPGSSRLLVFACTGVGDSAPNWDRAYSAEGVLEDPRCRDPQQ
jgi:hypothetical protein